jgi:DNA-binding transcriptional LysR family regulator
VALRIALPAIERLAHEAPRLRCELVEAEPEQALPALALGDVDLVIGDEWRHQPLRMPGGVSRHDLFEDPVYLVLAEGRTATLGELAGESWAAGHRGMAWDEMTRRTCREHGGFEPDVRHRCNDATVAIALAARGLAVTLLPRLPLREAKGVGLTAVPISRTIFAATRAADAARPSIQALLYSIRSTALPGT